MSLTLKIEAKFDGSLNEWQAWRKLVRFMCKYLKNPKKHRMFPKKMEGLCFTWELEAPAVNDDWL